MTGRLLSERLGKWHFWLFLVGFHMTFDVMHIPGLLGMPRRIYTYEPGRGWDTLNLIISIGAFIQAVAILVFVWNLISSYFNGAEAGNDPWDAWTLEWSTSTPPPAYNFATVPVVASRRPLWDLKHPEDPDSQYEGRKKPMSAAAISVSEVQQPWNLPYRGKVAMAGLIIAESAIFT